MVRVHAERDILLIVFKCALQHQVLLRVERIVREADKPGVFRVFHRDAVRVEAHRFEFVHHGVVQFVAGRLLCGLTFDMRGGRKWAKPACGRPLDGRVRRLFGDAHDFDATKRSASLARDSQSSFDDGSSASHSFISRP